MITLGSWQDIIVCSTRSTILVICLFWNFLFHCQVLILLQFLKLYLLLLLFLMCSSNHASIISAWVAGIVQCCNLLLLWLLSNCFTELGHYIWACTFTFCSRSLLLLLLELVLILLYLIAFQLNLNDLIIDVLFFHHSNHLSLVTSTSWISSILSILLHKIGGVLWSLVGSGAVWCKLGTSFSGTILTELVVCEATWFGCLGNLSIKASLASRACLAYAWVDSHIVYILAII